MSADQQYTHVLWEICSKQFISIGAWRKDVYEYRTSVARTRKRKNEIQYSPLLIFKFTNQTLELNCTLLFMKYLLCKEDSLHLFIHQNSIPLSNSIFWNLLNIIQFWILIIYGICKFLFFFWSKVSVKI